MKKYTNPELIINLVDNVDVLSVSTGGFDNGDDNLFDWADAI